MTPDLAALVAELRALANAARKRVIERDFANGVMFFTAEELDGLERLLAALESAHADGYAKGIEDAAKACEAFEDENLDIAEKQPADKEASHYRAMGGEFCAVRIRALAAEAKRG